MKDHFLRRSLKKPRSNVNDVGSLRVLNYSTRTLTSLCSKTAQAQHRGNNSQIVNTTHFLKLQKRKEPYYRTTTMIQKSKKTEEVKLVLVDDATTPKTKTKKKVKDTKQGSKKNEKEKKVRTKGKKRIAKGKRNCEDKISFLDDRTKEEEEEHKPEKKANGIEGSRKDHRKKQGTVKEAERKAMEDEYRLLNERRGKVREERKKKAELEYKQIHMSKEEEYNRAKGARLRIEARKKELKEQCDAKIKARKQALWKEREETERKVKLEFERIDQHSAKVNAWHNEQFRQQEQSKTNIRDESEKQESARLLQKLQNDIALEKKLKDAKKAAIESAHRKAEAIQKQALKKQQQLEEKFAAEAALAREQDAKALRLSEEWVKRASEQGRKLEQIVKDKERREQCSKEATEASKVALKIADRNRIKTKELQQKKALAVAKVAIDRKADELRRKAMERQQLLEEQLVGTAENSRGEETKNDADSEFSKEIAKVAEEGRKLEEILRNKERLEQENKARFSFGNSAFVCLETKKKESKRSKAMAATKAKIDKRKSELEDRTRRQEISVTKETQKQRRQLEKDNEEIDFQTQALEEELVATELKLREIEATAKMSFLVPCAP